MQIRHLLWAIAPLLACIQVAATPAAAARSISTCKTGYVEWERRPVNEVVAKSHTIFLATATEFIPDNSREGYDGYYVLSSTGTELKGGPQGRVVVYGSTPYPIPPQLYFELGVRHSEIANAHRQFGQTGPGGIGEVTAIGTHCPVAPRFVIGYTYLALLGTESRLSFEPIHSPRNDEWFQLVTELLDIDSP
ncbi:hypothetical protein [Erythrobacter neustonensis]|uniref:hypothetical protein n=1 Tax=Erythrobacter neustonensis TaxID=1112 RepID=UPI0012E73830|nr:hypothetical protein [Erythrobacter neustonensis]